MTREDPDGIAALASKLTVMNRRLDELRLATLYQALGPERILDFPVLDTPFRMYLPYATTDMVQRYILGTSTLFEMPLLRRIMPLVPPGCAVVDAGANIGNHTLFFGLVCRAGRIDSFEPLRTVFPILERNVALNGLDQVRCHNLVLGAQPGRAELTNFGPTNVAASSFRPTMAEGYPVGTLDQVALDRLDFLKIDVEGGHVAMLAGARETILRHRPTIWIEMRPAEDEVGPGDAALQALGYRQSEALSPTDFLYRPA
jgi:FkbM family methyltransferase